MTVLLALDDVEREQIADERPILVRRATVDGAQIERTPAALPVEPGAASRPVNPPAAVPRGRALGRGEIDHAALAALALRAESEPFGQLAESGDGPEFDHEGIRNEGASAHGSSRRGRVHWSRGVQPSTYTPPHRGEPTADMPLSYANRWSSSSRAPPPSSSGWTPLGRCSRTWEIRTRSSPRCMSGAPTAKEASARWWLRRCARRGSGWDSTPHPTWFRSGNASGWTMCRSPRPRSPCGPARSSA